MPSSHCRIGMPTKFDPGHLVMTPGAEADFSPDERSSCLNRHLSGDWGDLDAHDRKENERSLKGGFRLLSAYKHGKGRTLWIITEADRSVTTLLLPDEY